MTERVIITVRSGLTKSESDFEVPADMQIGYLKDILGKSLFSLSDEILLDSGFYLNGKRLDDEDTLASYGMWSGSIIVYR